MKHGTHAAFDAILFGALCAAFPAVTFAARTVSSDYTLASDEDWTADGVVTLSGNPTIDLAGHTLKVHAIAGNGAIASSMADLTSASGTITSSGGFNGDYPAANLFDDDTGTLAVRTATSGDPIVVAYDFGDATTVNCYRLFAAKLASVGNPGFPADWTFEGSADGADWTVLDTRSGQTLSNETWFTFDFSNAVAYRHYRMVVTKGSRWNSSTSKDPRIDFGGELELGFTSRGTLAVDLSGIAASDLSGITVSDAVAVETSGTSLVLDADLDMGGFPVSAAIDLNGHTLTVSSLSGGGTITDSSAAVPALPSSTTLSSNLTGPAGNLFDGDTSTFVYNGSTSSNPVFAVFDFGSATAIDHYGIYAYTSVGSPGFPSEWTFEGSDDAETWTALDARSSVSMAKDKWYSYDFANANEYRYYRLLVTKGSRWNGTSNPRIDVAGEMTLGRRNPGRLVVNVPAGRTVENADVALTGNLRLVKTGAGALVASKAGQTYLGGTEVAGGTLKCGAAVAGLFGPDGMGIRIASGGTFDIAGIRATGVNALGKYAFTLDGGTFANSVNITGSSNYQSPMRVALTADSMFSATAHSFLGTETAGRDGRIDLGGNELTCTIANGSYLRLNNIAIENGKISVPTATTGMIFIGYNESVVATNVDFSLNCPVSVRTGSTFKVRDYEALGSADVPLSGTGAMEVYGAFRPTGDYFYGCTLMDGSALDLSTRTTPLNALSSVSRGLANLSFAANATVNVTLGERAALSGTPLVSWTAATKPANVDTVRFVRADEDRQYSLVVKADGLYAETGLVVVFR